MQDKILKWTIVGLMSSIIIAWLFTVVATVVNPGYRVPDTVHNAMTLLLTGVGALAGRLWITQGSEDKK